MRMREAGRAAVGYTATRPVRQSLLVRGLRGSLEWVVAGRLSVLQLLLQAFEMFAELVDLSLNVAIVARGRRFDLAVRPRRIGGGFLLGRRVAFDPFVDFDRYSILLVNLEVDGDQSAGPGV